MSSSRTKYYLFYVMDAEYAEIYGDGFNTLYAYTSDKSIYKLFKSQRNMDIFKDVKIKVEDHDRKMNDFLMDNLEKNLAISAISYPVTEKNTIKEEYMDIALTISEREHLCSLDVSIQTNLTASAQNIEFNKIFKDKYWLELCALNFHKFYAHNTLGKIYMPNISYFDILLAEFGALFKYVGEVDYEK